MNQFKNNTLPETEELEQDELVSNTEINERQFYYLSIVKNYLESQLEQVNKQFEILTEKMDKNTEE